MSSTPEAVAAVTSQPLSRQQRRRCLLVLLALGLAICFWQLGGNGLVDETLRCLRRRVVPWRAQVIG